MLSSKSLKRNVPEAAHRGAPGAGSGRSACRRSASPRYRLIALSTTRDCLGHRGCTTRVPSAPGLRSPSAARGHSTAHQRRLLPESRLAPADEPPAEEAHEAANHHNHGDGDPRDRAGAEVAAGAHAPPSSLKPEPHSEHVGFVALEDRVHLAQLGTPLVSSPHETHTFVRLSEPPLSFLKYPSPHSVTHVVAPSTVFRYLSVHSVQATFFVPES